MYHSSWCCRCQTTGCMGAWLTTLGANSGRASTVIGMLLAWYGRH